MSNTVSLPSSFSRPAPPLSLTCSVFSSAPKLDPNRNIPFFNSPSPPPSHPAADVEYRLSAFKFLQACTSSVLNLRSLEDEGHPEASIERLAELLCGLAGDVCNNGSPSVQLPRRVSRHPCAGVQLLSRTKFSEKTDKWIFQHLEPQACIGNRSVVFPPHMRSDK
jgi:hypothetical protein